MDRMITTSEIAAIRRRTAGDHAAWANWLRTTYGTDRLPDAAEAKIYGQAWEDGQASGFFEVEAQYCKLAVLVLSILSIVGK